MSQQNISLLALTVLATAALTAQRFATAAGTVPAAGANALGVAQTDAAIGERTAVDVVGTALVTAGAAIAAGAAVAVGASGKAVTAAGEAVVVGRLAPGASAAADGDVVEVVLIQN